MQSWGGVSTSSEGLGRGKAAVQGGRVAPNLLPSCGRGVISGYSKSYRISNQGAQVRRLRTPNSQERYWETILEAYAVFRRYLRIGNVTGMVEGEAR